MSDELFWTLIFIIGLLGIALLVLAYILATVLEWVVKRLRRR